MLPIVIILLVLVIWAFIPKSPQKELKEFLSLILPIRNSFKTHWDEYVEIHDQIVPLKEIDSHLKTKALKALEKIQGILTN